MGANLRAEKISAAGRLAFADAVAHAVEDRRRCLAKGSPCPSMQRWIFSLAHFVACFGGDG